METMNTFVRQDAVVMQQQYHTPNLNLMQARVGHRPHGAPSRVAATAESQILHDPHDLRTLSCHSELDKACVAVREGVHGQLSPGFIFLLLEIYFNFFDRHPVMQGAESRVVLCADMTCYHPFLKLSSNHTWRIMGSQPSTPARKSLAGLTMR